MARRSLSNRLDDESVEDILTHLPVKSLMRFKCVSKSWQSLIEDPSFVRLHLSRSKQHPPQLLLVTTSAVGDFAGSRIVYSPEDGFEGGVAIPKSIPWPHQEAAMVGSIDGLFCFVDKSNAVSCIYNLGTRQATPWAKSCIPLQGGLSVTQRPIYGFGFDPLTTKYKVLCVWEITRSRFAARPQLDYICEIFTLGEEGNQWRKIDEVPPLKVYGSVKLYGSVGVYANGSIYWRITGESFLFPPDNELIVAFDVATEKFRVIQIPEFIAGSPVILRKCRGRKLTVTAIDGRMALIDVIDRCTVKLWISDDTYKEKKMTANWTEETISLPSSFQEGHYVDLNPVEGTDEIVIKSHVPSTESRPRGFVSLYIYGRTTKSFRKIDITGISPLLTHPFPYEMHIFRESLLPVQDAKKDLDEPTPMLIG